MVTLSNTWSPEPNLDICSSAPASNTALATGDYDAIGSVSFASVAFSSLSNGAYNDLTLNGDGESNVTAGGISKFGAATNWDLTDSQPTWASSKQVSIGARAADLAGTDNDPKLVVEHSAAAVASAGSSGSRIATIARAMRGRRR